MENETIIIGELSELVNRLKSAFQRFLISRNLNRESLEITDFKVSGINEDNILTLEITLGRPGVLIGAYGKTLDELTKVLNDMFSKDCGFTIKISIQESTLWFNDNKQHIVTV